MPLLEIFFVPFQIEIWQALNAGQIKQDLQKVYNQGIRSLAVVLMHSYT